MEESAGAGRTPAAGQAALPAVAGTFVDEPDPDPGPDEPFELFGRSEVDVAVDSPPLLAALPSPEAFASDDVSDPPDPFAPFAAARESVR